MSSFEVYSRSGLFRAFRDEGMIRERASLGAAKYITLAREIQKGKPAYKSQSQKFD
jgi:hypothetical protein